LLPVASQRALSQAYNQSTFVDKLNISRCLIFDARPVWVEEVEMIAEPKHEAHQDDTVRGERERKRHEKALDEALENTFPASDPASVEQPVLPAAHE
jgi:hypothetical protein